MVDRIERVGWSVREKEKERNGDTDMIRGGNDQTKRIAAERNEYPDECIGEKVCQ